MPAQKKHSSTRRRRNTASTATTLTHREEGEEPDIPELPPRVHRWVDDDGVHEVQADWCAETVEWWEDVWASPMSGEYLDADEHGLIRLAVLVDNYWLAPSAKTHAEVRLAQKDFGLTPYDRRRLEWTVEGAEAAKASGRKRRGQGSGDAGAANPQPAPEADPRQVLGDNVVSFPAVSQ